MREAVGVALNKSMSYTVAATTTDHVFLQLTWHYNSSAESFDHHRFEAQSEADESVEELFYIKFPLTA